MSTSKKQSSSRLGLAVAGILTGAALLAGCSAGESQEPVGQEKNGCSGPNGCAAKGADGQSENSCGTQGAEGAVENACGGSNGCKTPKDEQ